MSRPDAKLQFDTAWKYAPAPESTDHVRIDPQYEPVHRRRVRGPARAASTSTPSTRRAQRSSRASRKPIAGDVDRAVAAARKRLRAQLVEDEAG